jgi:hypothetical protein
MDLKKSFACVCCQVYSHEYACDYSLSQIGGNGRNDYVDHNQIKYDRVLNNLKTMVFRGMSMVFNTNTGEIAKLKSSGKQWKMKYDHLFSGYTAKYIYDNYKRGQDFESMIELGFNVPVVKPLKEIIDIICSSSVSVLNVMPIQHVASVDKLDKVVGLMEKFSVNASMGMINDDVGMERFYKSGPYNIYIIDTGAFGYIYYVVLDHDCCLYETEVKRVCNMLEFAHTPCARLKLHKSFGSNKYFDFVLFKSGTFMITEESFDESFTYIQSLHNDGDNFIGLSDYMKLIVTRFNDDLQKDYGGLMCQLVKEVFCSKFGCFYSVFDILEKYEVLIDKFSQYIVDNLDDDEMGSDSDQTVVDNNNDSFGIIKHVGELVHVRENIDVDGSYELSVLTAILTLYKEYGNVPAYVFEEYKLHGSDSINKLAKYLWFLLKDVNIDIFDKSCVYYSYSGLFRGYVSNTYFDSLKLILKNYDGRSYRNIRSLPWEFRYLLLIKPEYRMEVLFRSDFEFVNTNSGFKEELFVKYKDYVVDNSVIFNDSLYASSKVTFYSSIFIQSFMYKMINFTNKDCENSFICR